MSSSARTAVSARKLDVEWVRQQFPSLHQLVNGQPAAFFDSPGGTQVPQRVIDAIAGYLSTSNANSGGAFATSQRTDQMIADARAAMADFFNCASDEVVFGANMTTLTFALSRAIGRELKSGDELLVSCLDHDANVSPWVCLEERGVKVRTADVKPGDCTLDMFDLSAKIRRNTRLVAIGWAANAVGTINDVHEIVRLAHAAGSMAFLDAVHYAPHGPIDVRAVDCDFLACSSYKFFGPHLGILFGKREQLQRLRPYKLRACTEKLPDRWETGTQNHECLAGLIAAIDYIADVGRHHDPEVKTRREAILAAYEVFQQHERELAGQANQWIARDSGTDVLRHQGCREVRPAHPDGGHPHGGPHAARTGGAPWRARHLHLGRKLLRHRSGRAAGRAELGRHAAHWLGALQHRRRSGAAAGGVARVGEIATGN